MGDRDNAGVRPFASEGWNASITTVDLYAIRGANIPTHQLPCTDRSTQTLVSCRLLLLLSRHALVHLNADSTQHDPIQSARSISFLIWTISKTWPAGYLSLQPARSITTQTEITTISGQHFLSANTKLPCSQAKPLLQQTSPCSLADPQSSAPRSLGMTAMCDAFRKTS